MKRLIVSLSIIAIILAVGIFALITVSNKNDRLYGQIEAVISTYENGGDVSKEISELREFFENDYAKRLRLIVSDEYLGEMSSLISRLEPMVESECDEFTAECEALRNAARKIYLSELPTWERVL